MGITSRIKPTDPNLKRLWASSGGRALNGGVFSRGLFQRQHNKDLGEGASGHPRSRSPGIYELGPGCG